MTMWCAITTSRHRAAASRSAGTGSPGPGRESNGLRPLVGLDRLQTSVVSGGDVSPRHLDRWSGSPAPAGSDCPGRSWPAGWGAAPACAAAQSRSSSASRSPVTSAAIAMTYGSAVVARRSDRRQREQPLLQRAQRHDVLDDRRVGAGSGLGVIARAAPRLRTARPARRRRQPGRRHRRVMGVLLCRAPLHSLSSSAAASSASSGCSNTIRAVSAESRVAGPGGQLHGQHAVAAEAEEVVVAADARCTASTRSALRPVRVRCRCAAGSVGAAMMNTGRGSASRSTESVTVIDSGRRSSGSAARTCVDERSVRGVRDRLRRHDVAGQLRPDATRPRTGGRRGDTVDGLQRGLRPGVTACRRRRACRRRSTAPGPRCGRAACPSRRVLDEPDRRSAVAVGGGLVDRAAAVVHVAEHPDRSARATRRGRRRRCTPVCGSPAAARVGSTPR